MHRLVEVGGVAASQIDDLTGLAAHVGKLGHRRRRLAFNVALEGFDGNIGNADGGDTLMVGNTGFGSSFALRGSRSKGTLTFGPVPAPPIKLLEQFATATNSPRLNAVSVFPQRVVVGLLGLRHATGT